MKKLLDFSSKQLEQAIALKRQIEFLQTQLDRLSKGSTLRGRAARMTLTPANVENAVKTKRRTLSAKARARIAAAARARWAKAKAKGRNRL